MKALSLEFFKAGLDAADPSLAVRRNLSYSNDCLNLALADGGMRSGHWRKIHLIAFGKAAVAMAAAAQAVIPAEQLTQPGLLVTTAENAAPLPNFELMTAGHPLPDRNGLAAAEKIAARLQAAQSRELVLLLISGGASALLPYPVAGVDLSDKIATTQLLLHSGADIGQINCVRKHLSLLKGGGMTKLAAPADLHALILSDVIGDDLSTIASGPSVADPSSYADAIRVLDQTGIRPNTPPSVCEHLRKGAEGLCEETLKPADPRLAQTSYTLVGSNGLSVTAAARSAEQAGFVTRIYHQQLTGEARKLATAWAGQVRAESDPFNLPEAWIAGGESTVTVTGRGRGGRNQEFALAFAIAAEAYDWPYNWVFLSAGTDGRDGPTDAAGAIVDAQTLPRIRAAGIDPAAALRDNDAYTALAAADALLKTGATGTNVADIQILLLSPFSAYPT